MLRIVVMALVAGTGLGVTVGSYYGGVNIEGLLMGITSIICLGIAATWVYITDKKRVVKPPTHI